MKKQVRHFSAAECAQAVAVIYFVMCLPIVVLLMLPALLARSNTFIAAVLLFPIVYGVVTYLAAALWHWVDDRVSARRRGAESATDDLSGDEERAPVSVR